MGIEHEPEQPVLFRCACILIHSLVLTFLERASQTFPLRRSVGYQKEGGAKWGVVARG
jgi:hypothetical protein